MMAPRTVRFGVLKRLNHSKLLPLWPSTSACHEERRRAEVPQQRVTEQADRCHHIDKGACHDNCE